MTRLNASICPHCGTEHDVASAVVRKPAPAIEPIMRPGDATLCISCGEFAIMGDDDMLRRPTRAEARRLKRDDKIQLVRQAWSEMRRQRHG